MRKNFTTLLMGLALGSLGLTAKAATSNITPTMIEPTSTVIEVGEWWPMSVILQWGEQNIALNPESPDVEDGYIVNLNLKINGEEPAPDFIWGPPGAYAAYIYNGTYGPEYNTADAENPGTVLYFSWSYDMFGTPPSDGDVLTFTIPAGSILIGEYPETGDSQDPAGTPEETRDTNAEYTVTFTIGEVEYDDSVVKTFGSVVEFTGPNQCDFITRLNDTAPMSIVSNVSVNLADKISLVYHVDPTNPNSDMNYEFTTVKMDDGNYAYNFENVTDSQMEFIYTGETTVTFTFKSELQEGEQQGGLKIGEAIWEKPFQAGPEAGQRFAFTFDEGLDSEYIYIQASKNIFSYISLTNQGGFDLLGSSWKSNNTLNIIQDNKGNYGITGPLNVAPGNTIFLIYEGSDEVTLQIGKGIYTENGIPTYMEEATVSPQTISISNTTAGLEISWGDQEVEVREISSINLYSSNDPVDGKIVEMRSYFEFLSDAEGDADTGDPDDPTTDEEDTFVVGGKGKIILFKFGAALNNELEVGEYTFTLPAGMVENADGALNPKQVVTITVVSPTVGAVSPSEGYEFEADENVEFTIEFDGEPQINESEDEPIVITYMQDAEYVKRVDWAENVLYVQGNSIYLNLGSASNFEAGTYYLTLLAGAVTVEGTENELIDNFRFVINAAEVDDTPGEIPVYPTFSPSTQDEVAPFETISITWSGYTLALNENCEGEATFAGEPVQGQIVNNALVFTVEALEDGSYSLIVPAEYVIGTDSDGIEYYSASINVVYVVDESTGVSVIGASLDGNDAIYNLNGVKVDANKLSKGIYIVNGKKVVVR